MRASFQFGLAAPLLLIFSPIAHAQRGGGMGSVPAPMFRARTAVPAASAVRAPANRNGGSQTNSAASTVQANVLGDSLNFGGALTVQQLLNPFPGFGFNFEHLSATDHDIAIKALIDPATEARLRIAKPPQGSKGPARGFFLLDGGGAYAVPVGTDQQPQAQQPVVLAQQPAEQAVPQETAMAEPDAEEPPLPDEGDFTLVTRQGSQVEAVAFTRMNDKIVYITPTGGRRTMALTDLDSEATLHLNHERGTPLQLPL